MRRAVQRSAVLRRLNEALPPSGSILNALSRIDPFPSFSGPAVDLRPPNSAIARDPQVKAAGPGVVRILGTACGLGIEGSGWVARPGVVVTNAHVVAGTDDTVVQKGGEDPKLDAQAIYFDPTNDIAVLRVDGLDAPALRLVADPKPGSTGAVLGYPQNGPYDVEPARLGTTETVTSTDAYGRGPVRRTHHVAARARARGQLRRAGGRRRRARDDDGVRRHGRRGAGRRLRRAQRHRALRPVGRARLREHGPLRAVAQTTR